MEGKLFFDDGSTITPREGNMQIRNNWVYITKKDGKIEIIPTNRIVRIEEY